MGRATSIEWCHHTFNPWWGCTRVSPGCEHCYAETFSKRVGLKVWGQQADRRFFGDDHWAAPEKWSQDAEKAGERRRVFCASMADVFEDRRDLDEHRARLWRLIERTRGLDWLLLTKRPENHEMVPLAWQTGSRRPPNVWLGCTAENQDYANRRIPEILQAPWPTVRFVSYEPALGPIDFTRVQWPAAHHVDVLRGGAWDMPGWVKGSFTNHSDMNTVDWIVVGGESGPGARPFDVEWARSTIEQCRAARVPAFVKQLGARPFYTVDPPRPGQGSIDLRLSDRKGGEMAEWWPDLQVREFPATRTP